MHKVQTSHRYYIDRDEDRAVVRAVPTARVQSPATHRVDTPEPRRPAPLTRRARVNELVHQAIRRRGH